MQLLDKMRHYENKETCWMTNSDGVKVQLLKSFKEKQYTFEIYIIYSIFIKNLIQRIKLITWKFKGTNNLM
jgi:hypothetical protein